MLLDPCDFAKHRIRYISGRAALNVSSRSLSCLHGRDCHTADKKREDVERQVSIKLYCSSFLLQIKLTWKKYRKKKTFVFNYQSLRRHSLSRSHEKKSPVKYYNISLGISWNKFTIIIANWFYCWMLWMSGVIPFLLLSTN